MKESVECKIKPDGTLYAVRVSVTTERRNESLLRRYDANARKRYLLGATCMVERTLRAAQEGQLLFPPDELAALEKAAAAMNELVDTWQNKPTSAYNRWKKRELKRKKARTKVFDSTVDSRFDSIATTVPEAILVHSVDK